MTKIIHRQGLAQARLLIIGLMFGLLVFGYASVLAAPGEAGGSGFSGPGVVNVTDFGALGDGVNDDGYAIQAAIDAADGGIVFLPKGTYRITETLVIPNEAKGLTIYGAGETSVLMADAAIDALRVSGLHVTLSNFTLNGNHVGLNGIVMHHAGRSLLEKVVITDFTHNGILFDTKAASPTGNNNLAKLLYTTTNSNGLSGIAVREHQRDNNGLEFIGVESRKNGTTGLLYKGEGCRIIGGIFDNNNSYGIQLSENADGPFTTGCIIMYPWLEGNGRTVCAGQQALCGVFSAGRAVRNIIMRDIMLQGLTNAGASEDGEIMMTNNYGAALQFRGANNRAINFHPLSNTNQVEIYTEGPDASMSLILAGKGNGGVAIGRGGTPIQKHLSRTASWSPPTISASDYATTDVYVQGAVLGSTCHAAFSQPLPGGVMMSAAVTAPNVVRVTMMNNSKEAKSLLSGTVRVDVWVH